MRNKAILPISIVLYRLSSPFITLAISLPLMLHSCSYSVTVIQSNVILPPAPSYPSTPSSIAFLILSPLTSYSFGSRQHPKCQLCHWYTPHSTRDPSSYRRAIVHSGAFSPSASGFNWTAAHLVEAQPTDPSLEDIVLLCKNRGFAFQGVEQPIPCFFKIALTLTQYKGSLALTSEIYNGLSGFYDYGPLGVEVKRNIKEIWWKQMVQEREDIVGCDSTIMNHPSTWRATGHLDAFYDTYVLCNASNRLYRADKVKCAAVLTEANQKLGYILLAEGENSSFFDIQSADKQLRILLEKQNSLNATLQPLVYKGLLEVEAADWHLIPSPFTGSTNTQRLLVKESLIFSTHGHSSNENREGEGRERIYLRPETAQGIFTNFKAICESHPMKVPFGIAQIGKSFRNELSAKQFLYRMKEFEQMEIEYFILPKEETNDFWKPYFAQWIQISLKFLLSIGLPKNRLKLVNYKQKDLAHYARACTDICFTFPFGEAELMGVAYRADFDLIRHQNHSGKSMTYFDIKTKKKLFLHAIEPSFGVDRLILALIASAYTKDVVDGTPRTYLKLNPIVAPYKLAILPLIKSNERIASTARALFHSLKRHFNIFYDESGSIGRRYRRADEIGTPYCVTIDFDTLENNLVTLRDRDTVEQTRIHLSDVKSFLDHHLTF